MHLSKLAVAFAIAAPCPAVLGQTKRLRKLLRAEKHKSKQVETHSEFGHAIKDTPVAVEGNTLPKKEAESNFLKTDVKRMSWEDWGNRNEDSSWGHDLDRLFCSDTRTCDDCYECTHKFGSVYVCMPDPACQSDPDEPMSMDFPPYEGGPPYEGDDYYDEYETDVKVTFKEDRKKKAQLRTE